MLNLEGCAISGVKLSPAGARLQPGRVRLIVIREAWQ